jgi:hypothetical protein
MIKLSTLSAVALPLGMPGNIHSANAQASKQARTA